MIFESLLFFPPSSVPSLSLLLLEFIRHLCILCQAAGAVLVRVGDGRYTVYNGLGGHKNENQSLCNYVTNLATVWLVPSYLEKLLPTSSILRLSVRQGYYTTHRISLFETSLFCLIITTILLHCSKKYRLFYCDR